MVVLYILLTGGLHLDGLGDTFDGIFSNRPKEKILEIMKDSRLGTNALLALISVILIYTAFLSEIKSLPPYTLILMAVAGRTGIVVSAATSKYARLENSYAKLFIENCGILELIICMIIHTSIFCLILGIKGLFVAILTSIFSFVLSKYLGRRIGGITGDVLGAICEITQCFLLLLLYIIK
jgi:adenosylcobinamide-GDP ribazoletransferase